jgi:formate-dependent nitrite reductase membrane component NrfD
MAPETPLSYYGKPIIKEPVWKAEIPTYFFFGGLGGMSSSIALAARLSGNDVLARRASFTAAAALGVSPYLLIKDLGRPAKFINMLRVFKVTSPMNMGTWLLTVGGGAAGTAAALEVTGLFPGLKRVAEGVAGAFGPGIATYTGGLIADSVIPVWHDARQELPLMFGASGAAAAGGAAALFTPTAFAGPARRLAIGGALVELATHKAMEKRIGTLTAEPYHRGTADRYTKLGTTLTAAGAACMAIAGRRRAGAAAAGALLLAGSACLRFSVFHAGKISARDPKYTTLPQRERAAENAFRAQARR